MKKAELQNSLSHSLERGSAIIETALVAPMLVMFFLFVIDFLIMSKSKAVLTQAARDAGIYYSTYPLPLQIGATSTETDSSIYSDEINSDACIANNASPSSLCAEKSTFYHTYRMLSAEGGQLSLDYANGNFNMSFSYDGVRTSVTVSSKIKTLFFFEDKVIEKTAILRRIGP